MQPMSHDDTYSREKAQQSWAGMAQNAPEAYDEQANQWAVLRHEVEVEAQDMQQGYEPEQPGWEQRDTEEDTMPSLASFETRDDIQHVDIVVAGVGGGGMNAVNRMIDTHVRGVRFIAMNTDAQVLDLSQAEHRISLGQHYTKGLGAGGNAAVGMRAATESAAEIRAALGDANLVFIAAGMGGGTGTGAAPVVASIAKKLGALTIGIVTLPFSFEGTRRKRIAQEGLAELAAEVDALITVPNDRLLTANVRDRSLAEAFKAADDVLRQGVQGIAEVINVPGLVNVDFADVRSVLRGAGSALMSIGQGSGNNRAQEAVQQAVDGGFLSVTIRGARRVLFNISGGEDMTLFEVNEVAEGISSIVDESADITFGAVIDPTLRDAIRVTLIAAGMEESITGTRPGFNTNARPYQGSSRGYAPAPAHQALPITPSIPPMPPLAPRPEIQAELTPPTIRPLRPATPPPARPQRSLDDLRGLRGLGRRRTPDPADEELDIPPYFKRG